MKGSIIIEVNKFLEDILKRELTGEELLVATLTLSYITTNDINIVPK